MSIRRGFSANLLGTLLPLALSLVTVPLYLRLLGAERYGVIAIAWLLLGYFDLFDLGLGRATAQKIAAIGKSPEGQTTRREAFWTALILNAGFGLLGAVVFWPVAEVYFTHYMPIPPELRGEMLSAIPWLAMAIPLSTVGGVLSGSLQGSERFVEINALNVVSTVIFQPLPLLVAWRLGPSLGLLLPVTLLTRFFIFPVMMALCRKYVIGTGPVVFARPMARELLGFGGWVTVTAFVGPMMVILDRFVIGQLMGARAIAYYSVPFQLAQRTTLLPNALLGAMFPRLTSAGPDEARRLATQAMVAMAATLTIPVLAGVLLLGEFLLVWVGPDMAEHATLTGRVLLVSFWLNAQAYVPYSYLQASGRPNLVARAHLAELLPYFVLLYLGIHYAGIVGAALAFGIRVGADLLLLSGFSGLLRTVVRQLLVPFAILVLAVVVVPALPLALRSTGGALLLVGSLFWQWKVLPEPIRQRVQRNVLGRLGFRPG